MYTHRYVPTSCYLRQQLHSNMKRVQKLAQLQSKMILQDANNNHLRDQLMHLQSQNDLLKDRLMNKYYCISNFTKLNQTKERAIDRANKLLRNKEEQLRKTSSSLYSYSNNRSYAEKPVCQCMRDDRLRKNNRNRTMSQFEPSPDQSIRLNKKVYFSPKKDEQRISNSPLSRTLQNNEDSMSVLQEVQNKFPSRVSQPETKKPHQIIEQYQKKDECFSQMQNSEFPEGVKSAMYDRFNMSKQKKKKKTFLTIVSQSSVVKKD